jgi:hypothetical protein
MTRRIIKTTAAPPAVPDAARRPAHPAAMSALHHEHMARLMSDLANPLPDRARLYLFRGKGGTGKSGTAHAMARATGRTLVNTDPTSVILLTQPLVPGGNLIAVVEDYDARVVTRANDALYNVPGLIVVFIALDDEPISSIPPYLTVLNFGPLSGADAAAIARDYFPDAGDEELADLAAAADGMLTGGQISAMCRRHRGSVRDLARAIVA